jgi:hypothetical protein
MHVRMVLEMLRHQGLKVSVRPVTCRLPRAALSRARARLISERGVAFDPQKVTAADVAERAQPASCSASDVRRFVTIIRLAGQSLPQVRAQLFWPR